MLKYELTEDGHPLDHEILAVVGGDGALVVAGEVGGGGADADAAGAAAIRGVREVEAAPQRPQVLRPAMRRDPLEDGLGPAVEEPLDHQFQVPRLVRFHLEFAVETDVGAVLHQSRHLQLRDPHARRQMH